MIEDGSPVFPGTEWFHNGDPPVPPEKRREGIMETSKIISKVYDRVAEAISLSRTTEKDRKYASEIVDDVLKTIKSHEKEGCLDSEFRMPNFTLAEQGLVDYTLQVLYLRCVIRREVRYFLNKREGKE